MDEISIDQVLDEIRSRLHLSKEAETELMAEIRTHLEDTVADARLMGQDESLALREAADMFKPAEVVNELQSVHADYESIYAIAAVALPVLLALGMRWLAYAPDGTALGWQQLLLLPGFWIVATVALVIPGMLFKRWRFALVGWGIFWLLTVIFVVFPHINHW